MLFAKYASPMILIDKMILTRRFHEFVNEFVKLHNEEVEDSTAWELWLHRIFDRDFKDFKAALNGDMSGDTPSAAELESTVRDSMNILNDFRLS